MRSTQGRRTRSDATRNRDAIIEATLRTLNERPRANMEEIAAAAGVSRGTLYSHFPSRRELVIVTLRQVLTQANARLAGIDPTLSPGDSVDALVATSWRVLSQFAGISAAAEGELSRSELRRLHHEPADRIRRLVMRGRGDGTFRTDQDVSWQVECIYAIIRAGASLGRTDRPPRRDAAAEMATTVRAILAAAPAGSETETRAPLTRRVGPL